MLHPPRSRVGVHKCVMKGVVINYWSHVPFEALVFRWRGVNEQPWKHIHLVSLLFTQFDSLRDHWILFLVYISVCNMCFLVVGCCVSVSHICHNFRQKTACSASIVWQRSLENVSQFMSQFPCSGANSGLVTALLLIPPITWSNPLIFTFTTFILH